MLASSATLLQPSFTSVSPPVFTTTKRGVVVCGAGLAVVPAAATAAHGAADRPGGGRSTRCARPWRPSRAASACSAPRRPRPGAPGPAPHRQHSRVRIARPRSGPGRSPARLGPRPPRCRGAGSGSGSGSIERKISSFLATNRSRCDGAPCRAQGCRRRRSPRRMCCRCCYSPSRRSSSSRHASSRRGRSRPSQTPTRPRTSRSSAAPSSSSPRPRPRPPPPALPRTSGGCRMRDKERLKQWRC